MKNDTREFYIKRLKQDWNITDPELIYDAYGSQCIAGAMLRSDYQRQRSPEGIRDPEAYLMKTLKGEDWRKSKKDSSSNISEADSIARDDEFYKEYLKRQSERGAN